MDLTLNSDQQTLATALEGLTAPFRAPPSDFRDFALANAALERQLEEGEFFDVAAAAGLGRVAAAWTIERLARLPYAAEVALSMLVRPALPGGPWPRPLALVEQGRPGRFVHQAKTLLIAQGERLGLVRVSPEDVEPVAAIYAYPMGRVKRSVDKDLTLLAASESSEVRTALRTALAAEAAGAMQAAIDATVEHLSVRKQFGRPLGSFQALRHRMAECAVLAGGVKWLAMKAAASGEAGDAALAAFHAQDSAARIVYDLHQMLGAMGMTLEHPLHLWTYRLKLLISELGGRSAQASAVARCCFG